MASLALQRLRAPLRTVTLLLLQSLAACSQESKPESTADSKPKAAQKQPVPNEIWKEFSGKRAYAEVE